MPTTNSSSAGGPDAGALVVGALVDGACVAGAAAVHAAINSRDSGSTAALPKDIRTEPPPSNDCCDVTRRLRLAGHLQSAFWQVDNLIRPRPAGVRPLVAVAATRPDRSRRVQKQARPRPT